MMGSGHFTDACTRDAVAWIAARHGLGKHLLQTWKRKFTTAASNNAEFRRLERQLVRVSEQRGIPEKAAAQFASDAKSVKPARRHRFKPAGDGVCGCASRAVFCPCDVPCQRIQPSGLHAGRQAPLRKRA